jgi:hypothetical protein
MDNLMRVSEILSSCLTTEAVQSLRPVIHTEMGSPQEKKESIKNQLFVELLEHAGRKVMDKLNRELAPDEVMLIYNRVKQFMTARGYD